MAAGLRRLLCCSLLAIICPSRASAQFYKSFPAFTGVQNPLAVEGFIIPGPTNTTYDIRLEGPPEVVDSFQAVVQNGVLILGLKPNADITGSEPVNFTVRVPNNKLVALSLSGAGILEASGLVGSRQGFTVQNSGAGFLSIVNLATRVVQARLSGAGTVYIEGEISSVDFASSGTGKGFVSGVLDSVSVTMSGAGSVSIDSGSDTLQILGSQSGTGKVFYNSGTCAVQGFSKPCAQVSSIPLPYV